MAPNATPRLMMLAAAPRKVGAAQTVPEMADGINAYFAVNKLVGYEPLPRELRTSELKKVVLKAMKDTRRGVQGFDVTVCVVTSDDGEERYYVLGAHAAPPLHAAADAAPLHTAAAAPRSHAAARAQRARRCRSPCAVLWAPCRPPRRSPCRPRRRPRRCSLAPRARWRRARPRRRQTCTARARARLGAGCGEGARGGDGTPLRLCD
jgi:hypothetical protein